MLTSISALSRAIRVLTCSVTFHCHVLRAGALPKGLHLRSVGCASCCCFVAQLCPTLSNPLGCSLPGSSVRGISQARCWSGLPFPSPGDLPHPGTKLMLPALAVGSLPPSYLGGLWDVRRCTQWGLMGACWVVDGWMCGSWDELHLCLVLILA